MQEVSGKAELAGELGFEPRSSVLETDSLTVELIPPVKSSALSCKSLELRADNGSLLRFFVIRVLPAGIAKLRELQAPSGRLLVLRRRVVPVFALRALQCNNFAHSPILTDFAELHERRESKLILKATGKNIPSPAWLALLEDLGDGSGSDCASAFADGEA